MTKQGVDVLVNSNLMQILMGGVDYLIRARGSIRYVMLSTGIGAMFGMEKIISEKLVNKLIERTLHSYKPHVLHINDPSSTLFKVKDVPKMFVIHGSLDFASKSSCKRLSYIYQNADNIVTCSRHAQSILRELCGIDSTVINHGVDIELFNPLLPKNKARERLDLDDKKLIILWNARMDPLKGLHTLIRALANSKIRSDFNVLLYVKTRTINKSFFNYIKYLIKKFELDKEVIIDVSWTPLHLMPLFYRAADIFINTSYTEAFGSLTMLEAMASGVPIIARNASSNPEALGDAGLLFDDEDDLREAIEKLAYEPKIMKYYGYKALYGIYLRGLTLDVVARKYIELYNKIA
ncbi:MAG: glycosyltransferase family 4 protein [Infirmifilum sp.]